MTLVALVIILVLVAVVLLLVLRQLMKKYASSATAHLESLSQDYVLKQEELRNRLEEADRRYQEQLVKANKEIDALRAKSVQEADSIKQQILEQARKEGEQIVQKAVDTREAMRQEIERSLDGRAVEMASRFFEDLLPKSVQDAAHEAWLKELLEVALPQVMQENPDKAIREVSLVSALDFSDSQTEYVESMLKKTLGSGIQVNKVVDRHLIAGMTLNVGFMVLDGSLISKLKQASRKAQEAA